MNNRNIQLATVGLFFIAVIAAVQIFRGTFRGEPEANPEIQGVATKGPPPSERNPIELDVRGNPDSDDGYAPEATNAHLFPNKEFVNPIDEDEVLTEEECQAFVAHMEGLGSSSGKGGGADESSSFCGKNKVPAEFARCALTKSTQAEVAACAGMDDPEKAQRQVRKMLREAEESFKAAGVDVDPEKFLNDSDD